MLCKVQKIHAAVQCIPTSCYALPVLRAPVSRLKLTSVHKEARGPTFKVVPKFGTRTMCDPNHFGSQGASSRQGPAGKGPAARQRGTSSVSGHGSAVIHAHTDARTPTSEAVRQDAPPLWQFPRHHSHAPGVRWHTLWYTIPSLRHRHPIRYTCMHSTECPAYRPVHTVTHKTAQSPTAAHQKAE